jgi:hypothetical protein
MASATKLQEQYGIAWLARRNFKNGEFGVSVVFVIAVEV